MTNPTRENKIDRKKLVYSIHYTVTYLTHCGYYILKYALCVASYGQYQFAIKSKTYSIGNSHVPILYL